MSLSSDEIRQQFIDYFVRQGHEHVASGSLVPAEDPTLLFTNAGMNQFKGVFLGDTTRENSRAVTSQKCMRVSGKHNDLETVGPSLYHHTFFEMLGNFSFGDYFKKDAIRFAWELFTEEFGLEKERLWATVYLDDDEAAELWESGTDLLPGRVLRLGEADNYWSMGDTGPCGPCSELHYDYEWDGNPVEDPDMDSARFVELWNLVFMQFNQGAEGKVALPNPSIDTGAGLERLTAVLQNTRSNYETDLFRPIIDATASEVDQAYGRDADADVALRVIADHGRAMAFLLADGIMPANEGRGYVLRRLLRRAMRFGMKIGFDRPFMNQTALAVVDRMHTAYPELAEHRELIERVVRSEEERFLQALAGGSRRFNELVEELREAGADRIPGDEAFKLYDTYGLPLELTREFAVAEQLAIDEAGFQEALERQRERARTARKDGAGDLLRQKLRDLTAEDGGTETLAWETAQVEGARVVGLVRDDELVERLESGQTGGVLTERTPFYAESGGQVGDTGRIRGTEGRARVLDTQRPVAGVVLHRVELVEGAIAVGDAVDLEVDDERRRRTRRHHTATHLLHAALRDQLGDHVRQAGSRVEPGRLRFDFTHYDAIDEDRLAALERAVNAAILADTPLSIEFMSHREATEERGALAFFGDKYGERVRVVQIPGVSTELCGGTHVERTGEIGPFLITREESVAAGTRRVEAVAGEAALEMVGELRGAVRDVSGRLRVPVEDLGQSVDRLLGRVQEAEREVERLRVKMATREADAGIDEAIEVEGMKVLRREVDGLDASAMRNLCDELKSKLGSGVIVLGARRDGKAALIVSVTDDLTDRIGAGDIVRELAAMVGGGGGGRRDMAQAGGPDAAKVSDALEKVPEVIRELL